MTLPLAPCFVCREPVASPDTAARIGDHVVHAACASIAIAQRKHEAKVVHSPAPSSVLARLFGRLFRHQGKVRAR